MVLDGGVVEQTRVGDDRIKVSVIVATYRSGAALTDRVMASLDAQTLATDEFEVLLVDDGSGDGTVDLLHALAAERSNVRVHEIEHSGWPSRPRNTGIDLARGTYVCFMDHDDALYPEALEQATTFALAHGLDVLNPKEVLVRPEASWDWMGYDEDVVADAAGTRAVLMVPSRPHKLYRTDFLRRHGIRFPDGADVHWEDRYFNARCLTSLEAFGVLASEPFYQWIDTGANSSRAYEGDPTGWDLEVYWGSLTELFDFLASVHSERDIAELRQREYVNRVLPWAGPRRQLDLDPGLVERSFRLMAPFVGSHCPPELDATLSPVRRARAALLRAGDLPSLRRLATVDARAGIQIRLGAVRIEPDASIVVAAYARLLHDGELARFEETPAGRLRRRLPEDLVAVLPEEVLDVTEAIEGFGATIAVRHQEGHDVYPQQTTTMAVRRPQADGECLVRFDFRAVIDPSTARLGKPLAPGTWEIGAECDLIGFERARGIVMPTAIRHAQGRLVDGRVVVVRPDAEKRLLLDLGSSPVLWEVAGVAEVGADAVGFDRPLGPRTLVVRLPALPASGPGATACEVELRPVEGGTPTVLAARLEADGAGSARVSAGWRKPSAGEYDVVLRHHDLEAALPVRLTVPRLGPAKAVAHEALAPKGS